MGFPTSYFLNVELEVVDIKRGGVAIPPRTGFKKAFDMNYSVFNDRLVCVPIVTRLTEGTAAKKLYESNATL